MRFDLIESNRRSNSFYLEYNLIDRRFTQVGARQRLFAHHALLYVESDVDDLAFAKRHTTVHATCQFVIMCRDQSGEPRLTYKRLQRAENIR